MVIRTYPQREYPADLRTFGSDEGRPASGYFSLHFTYPDTEYDDATEVTWAGGSSANDLGMHFLVRTPLATSSAPANTDNFFVIDLNAAGFDLGTESAARMIAAAINSSRDYQTGAHSRGRYLRAKYQRMSGKASYTGKNVNSNRLSTGDLKTTSDYTAGSTNTLSLTQVPSPANYEYYVGDSLYTAGANSRYIGTIRDVYSGANPWTVVLDAPIAIDLPSNTLIRNDRLHLNFQTVTDVPTHHLPTDIPQQGTITDSSGNTLRYDGWSIVQTFTFDNPTTQGGEIVFRVVDYDTAANITGTASFTINNEVEQQHTVVVTWESDTPTGGGYWGTANGGPIIQGLGAPIPVWHMAAKPMDGGNMGLPDVGHESRGAQPSALSGHGYSRFSIEGLNSCYLPSLPPPDMPFDGPSIMGEAAADPFQWTGLNDQRDAVESDELLIEEPEFGVRMDDRNVITTDCIVSTNNASGLGVGTTEVKVLAPNTDFRTHFGVGDVIYSSEGEAIGTISAIEETHDTAFDVLGPRERDSGWLCTNTETAGHIHIRVDQDPTVDPSPWAVGDVISDEYGNEYGIITSFASFRFDVSAGLSKEIAAGTRLYRRQDLTTPATSGLAYTQEDFDDGRQVLLYNAGGLNITDKEAFGDGTSFDSYATDNHPRLMVSDAGDAYAKITLPATFTGLALSGAVNFGTMKVTNFYGEIPANGSIYRACVKITISSSTIVLRNGQSLFKAPPNADWAVALENGHQIPGRFATFSNAHDERHAQMGNLRASTVNEAKAIEKFGLKSEKATITTASDSFTGAQGYVCRPFRTTRAVSTERVRGLIIPNEEMVWENLSVVDDKGQELVLQGGSPFGTVIKDYTHNANRVNPATGTETPLPSVVGSGVEPNLSINLPSQDAIPGNILVRSGHDRVQAWSNLSWGMGGLSAPTTEEAGVREANNQTTSFDTHDRVLHFHPVRILHDDMASKFGLTPNTTPGAVPSGTTRLYAAHRLSDHTERGSVLKETQNGVEQTYTHPHHRIRFGRQGHHFITPLTTRGTPKALRRQLHRSHGSAYTLLFEAESEHKHWGFQSVYNGGSAPPSSTLYYLDSLEVKSETYNTGSFASDGFPMGEIEGRGLPNWRRYDGTAPQEQIDVLFAPGQVHTKVEGATEQARWVSAYTGKDGSGPYSAALTQGPVSIQVSVARTVNNRHNAGEEFALNGFMVSNYLLMGGRPPPAWIDYAHEDSGSDPFVYSTMGLAPGWRTPRVATEIATVPPLLVHDPDLVNASAVPVASDDTGSSFNATDAHQDLALLGPSDTNSGATPDAFLCTWTAEYAHPALLGTVREQYMTFRYRQAGMPNAVQQPSVRGLYLRNAHDTGSSGVDHGMPFERIYAFQWLQQYGYNGLNAGGHGTNWGQRAAGAVLMGHSGLREPNGTLELLPQFTANGEPHRFSRGEGIGDGLSPRKVPIRRVLDSDGTQDWNVVVAVHDPLVAIDWSRRLPVRAFGFRNASDALNMLAGDPAETSTSMDAILRSARFDGGKHDSLNDLPTGGDWPWATGTTYTGVERTAPIGFVVSQQTNEAYDGQGFNRLSNAPWAQGERRVGMGRVLQHEMLGVVNPRAMPAGLIDAHRTEFATITGSSAKFMEAKSVNTGSDPIIGLNHHSGDKAKAADSVEAVLQASEFGASVGSEFYHHKGSNLHLNAHPVDVKTATQEHYPAVGWGTSKNMPDTTQAERGTLPIPLHEIADHRQVQSDLSPRLGLNVETETERSEGRNTDYMVTSTKAVSLHSDLAVGQIFPITPSWVQETRWTKTGASKGSITTTAARPNETYGGRSNPNQRNAKPKWTLNEDTDLSALSNPFSDDIQQANGAGIRDHWAVRGSADLPPWGGVFILRKTWLERREEGDLLRTRQGGTNATAKAQIAQPVRRYADYIVRMVRPLKVFGYTSENDSDGTLMNQDGWLLGPYATITEAGSKDQPFTRDKRYGMFESSTNSQGGDIQGISSPYDAAPTIEWPDANERDVVWHLIPSANMLQHFKSDAARRDRNGVLNAFVDARYSQSTHPGGGESISQTETVYATDDTFALDPYFRRDKDVEAVRKQPDYALAALGPRTTIKFDTGTALIVEDATAFSKTGYLVIIGLTGSVRYSSRTETKFTILSATGQCSSIADLAGYEVRQGSATSSEVATIAHLTPPIVSLVVLPSLVDNAVSVGMVLSDKWDATSSDDSADYATNMAYRGIGHYNPSDFIMLSPQRFVLSDGQNGGFVSYRRTPGTGGLLTPYVDGRLISTFAPPYLIDEAQQRWRVAGVRNDDDTEVLFRNLNAETLSAAGMGIGAVRFGQHMGVGVRTSDAALMLLNDLASAIPGADLTIFNIQHEQATTDTGVYADYSSSNMSLTAARTAFLFSHPSLRDMLMHSASFISRKGRGIGVMDILRDLSRIDGHQLSLSENGLLIYSPEVFTGKERRVGTSSGPRNITVSTMLEMANRVIVEGDAVAENEVIRGDVRDIEKMREMGGPGGEEGVERTMKVAVPGVRERNVALRLAKGLLRRSTQGSSLIRVEGLLQSTDIRPGEILNVDFSMENIRGEFAVFEVRHDYATGMTDLIIGQYEKGIEGLIADLQSSTASVQEEDPTRTKEQFSISLNAPIRVVSAQRVLTRFVNGTRFLIGARHRGEPTTHQLGTIGVRGGRTGVTKNGAVTAGSTTNLVVTGTDATLRYSQYDAVLNDDHELVGFVSSVTATSIVLSANNIVAIADGDNLRVASKRMDPVGHSKSVFYEVR